jgi:hypothetical protein
MENRNNPQRKRHSAPDILGGQSSVYDDPYAPLRRFPAAPTQLANVETPVATPFSEHPFLLPIDYVRKLHDVTCWPKGVRVCDREWTPGNARFQVIVDASVERYRRASGRRQKIEICKQAVEAVRCAGGSFIRYIPSSSSSPMEASLQQPEASMPAADSFQAPALAPLPLPVQGGRWMDIGNIKAREKASHAIRQEIKKMRKRRASLPTTKHAAAAASSSLQLLSSPSTSTGSQSSGLSGVAASMLLQDGSMASQPQAPWTSAAMVAPDSLTNRDDGSSWDWEDTTTLAAAMDSDPQGMHADLASVWGDDDDFSGLQRQRY